MEVIILHFCRCVSLPARSEAGNWRQDESTESVRSLILSADNTQLCFLFRSTQDRNNSQRNALKMKNEKKNNYQAQGDTTHASNSAKYYWRRVSYSSEVSATVTDGRDKRTVGSLLGSEVTAHSGLSETHLAECWCKHIFSNVDTIHNLVFEWF